MTFAGHLADRVAAFGGSWTFIMSFCSLLLWMAANTFCSWTERSILIRSSS